MSNEQLQELATLIHQLAYECNATLAFYLHDIANIIEESLNNEWKENNPWMH